jgi:hypothetical protein
MINHFPNSFAIAAQQGHSHPSYAGGGGVHIIQIDNLVVRPLRRYSLVPEAVTGVGSVTAQSSIRQGECA